MNEPEAPRLAGFGDDGERRGLKQANQCMYVVVGEGADVVSLLELILNDIIESGGVVSCGASVGGVEVIVMGGTLASNPNWRLWGRLG